MGKRTPTEQASHARRERARRARRRAEANPELVLKGTSVLSKNGVEVGRWDKTRQRGRDDAAVPHIPDPKTITKISTLYDQLGEVTAQWIAEKPADVARIEAWQQFAKELTADLSRLPPVKQLGATTNADLMACYPVGDHHLGMLAWKYETEANYDTEISEALLNGAMEHLVNISPACDDAAVVFLGDFMHYDNFDAVTPTSGNRLDADCRFPRLVRAAIRLMRQSIFTALQRHRKVRVIVEIGNHDPVSSIFLMEALKTIYENEPRIFVDTSPKHFHYFTFGSTLVGTHHGHGTKLDKLPLIMATDRPIEWGASRHRYWWTGHLHNQVVLDFPGCSVERFRVLPPADAWASEKGYRSTRDMKAIMLHKKHGEVARYTVNPEMLEH